MRKLIIIPFLLLALTTIGQNTTVDTLRFKRGGKAWQVITWGNSDSVKINGIVFKMGGTGDSFWEATGPSAQYIKPAYPPTFGIKYPLIQYMNEPNTPKENCQVWWRHSDGALVGPVHNEPGGGGLGESVTVDGSIPIYYNDTANRTVYVTADSIRNIYAPFVISNRGKNSTVIVQSLESRPFDTLEQLELHYGDWAMIYPDSTVFHFITGSRSNNQVVYVPDSLIVPPRTDLIVQWLDGTRIGNEFIDISGHGYNVDIINNDIALQRGFPYKSAAMIAQKAANFGAIPDTNHFWFQDDGTPNQIPVTSLFQNIDYSGLIFSRHVGQVLSASGEETTEPYVTDIITYSTPLKQADITDAELFFSVPKISARAKWLDPDYVGTSDGNRLKPWKDLTTAESQVATGDTVYVLTGNAEQSYIQASKGVAWIGVGLSVIKTSQTSNGVIRLLSSNTKLFKNLIIDGQSKNGYVGFYSVAQNGHFENCLFRNPASSVIPISFQYAGTIENNYFKNCNIDITNSQTYGILQADSLIGCYIKGASTYLISTEKSPFSAKWNRLNVTLSGHAFYVEGNSYRILGNEMVNAGKGSFFFAGGSQATTGNYIIHNTTLQGDMANQVYVLIKGTGVKIGYNKFTLTGTSTSGTENQSFIISGQGVPSPDVFNNVFDITTSRLYSAVTFITSSGNVCGANIVRNNKFYLRNCVDGNAIQIGSENDVQYTGKFNGSKIYNNYVLMPPYWGGGYGTAHTIFFSGGDFDVYGNFVYGGYIGYIQKGQGTTFSTVVHHNIAMNCGISFYSKAVDGIKFYNNTIESTANTGGSLSAFHIVKNGSWLSTNNEIKNNIIINKQPITSYVYTIDAAGILPSLVCDYNQVYTGSWVMYNNGTSGYWADWQALGKDTHSTFGDISFRNKYDFKLWPVTAITGTSVGSYNVGLSINTKIGDTIKTATQGVNWQMGAYVQNGEIETTDTVKQLPYQVTAGDVTAWTKGYELAKSAVTSVTGTSPIVSSGGLTPAISINPDSLSVYRTKMNQGATAYTWSDHHSMGYITGLSAGTYTITATTANALSSQYIDWNSSTGGSSIANKPTMNTTAWNTAARLNQIQNICGWVEPANATLKFIAKDSSLNLTKTGTLEYVKHGRIAEVTATTQKVSITATAGNKGKFYFYMDDLTGVLKVSQVPWTLLDTTIIPVAAVEWDKSVSDTSIRGLLHNEMHEAELGIREVHYMWHKMIGTRYIGGGVLSGQSIAPNSPTTADNNFGITSTTIADDDLDHSLDALADPAASAHSYIKYYRTSATTYKWDTTAAPYYFNGTGTYVYWDNGGTMTQGSAGNFYTSYLCLTNVKSQSGGTDGKARFMILPGRGSYSTAALAGAELPSTWDMTGFGPSEIVVYYRFIWQTSNAYTGALGKCRLAVAPQLVNQSIGTSSTSAPVNGFTVNGNNIIQTTSGNVGYGTGDAPQHKNAIVVSKGTTEYAWNATQGDWNKDRTTHGQSADTSCLHVDFTDGGKPLIEAKNNAGVKVMDLDSTYKFHTIKVSADSAIVSGMYANGNSSTAVTIYATRGNTQTVTRTGNCTYTIAGMTAGQSLRLVMVHEASATAYTVAFSPTVIWAGGVTPTFTNTSGAVDVVSIIYDGTRYLGMQSADFK